ncbi:MAG: DUF6020 family protein [Bacillus sp. (in: Bacteria)]|nr:DUF6020 family protein [Bacillus sp. (in: firmicutes)]MCM1425585.1 DUF6020 family protein [Eubacterium sp.]
MMKIRNGNGTRNGKKSEKYSVILGFGFALSCVLGYRLQHDGYTLHTIPELALMILAVLIMTFVSTIVARILFKLLAYLQNSGLKSRAVQKEYSGRQAFFFYAGVILLFWIPVFLAYYPSVFAYDAEAQFYQFLSHDYSTHHPLIHTLFLGAFFWLGGNVFGSYSAGMALHSVVQMLIMAGILGYAMTVLYRMRTSWVMRLVLLVFYALFPVHSILSLSTTKDVLFSGLVLLYVVKLWQWQNGGYQSTKSFLFSYIIISVLMLLFRNNALYAYLAAQPFIWFLWKKSAGGAKAKVEECRRERKYYVITMLATLALFLAASAELKTAVMAQSGSPREMLSVPLQQMARTRVMHEEEIDASMRSELNAYLPEEWVFAAYNPHLADPVKNRAVIHDNPAGLIKTWLKLGVQFPMTYVDAFLDNSIGYWYIADTSHAQIYGIGTESGFGYLSTDNRTMPAGCEIVEHSYLPGLRAFMERMVSDNEYQKIPVLSVIFAPAFYWWLLCLYMAFYLSEKKYEKLLPVMFLLMYYLTLLLSPTVLIRYMYPFVISVPMILCLMTTKKKR